MKDRFKNMPMRTVFEAFNYLICIVAMLLCLFPLVHIFALSISSSAAVNAGKVLLWPVEPSLDAYLYVSGNMQFFASFITSVKRVLLGLGVNMLMTMLAAYPLAKSQAQFGARQFYVWLFVFTMLFGAGMIPNYLLVSKLGLVDSIWALILPGAVPVYNVILLQNFIKALPEEISESALIDGAGHWKILRRIIIPLCAPSLAAISLFVIVSHWNEWFNGILYMNDPKKYPLQSYLRTLVISVTVDYSMNPEDLAAKTAQSSNRAAQMFLAMLPVLMVYPFLQKHFTTGIVLGSVKG